MKPHPPIYSKHDEDLSMRDAIEAFIVGLAERIDALQDAELAGDLEEVIEVGVALAQDSEATGYPSLVDVMRAVLASAAAKSPEEVRKGLVDLTEIAQGVRRGSRGAA